MKIYPSLLVRAHQRCVLYSPSPLNSCHITCSITPPSPYSLGVFRPIRSFKSIRQILPFATVAFHLIPMWGHHTRDASTITLEVVSLLEPRSILYQIRKTIRILLLVFKWSLYHPNLRVRIRITLHYPALITSNECFIELPLSSSNTFFCSTLGVNRTSSLTQTSKWPVHRIEICLVTWKRTAASFASQ